VVSVEPRPREIVANILDALKAQISEPDGAPTR
jgi:hypothetical protein